MFYSQSGGYMNNLFTDFSERKLSFVVSSLFLVGGLYQLLMMNDFINGFKFIIACATLLYVGLKIDEKLMHGQRNEYRAGLGLIIIGSFIKVFGILASHIIWLLGMILTIKSINKK